MTITPGCRSTASCPKRSTIWPKTCLRGMLPRRSPPSFSRLAVRRGTLFPAIPNNHILACFRLLLAKTRSNHSNDCQQDFQVSSRLKHTHAFSVIPSLHVYKHYAPVIYMYFGGKIWRYIT
jgi:hypothetical protein